VSSATSRVRRIDDASTRIAIEYVIGSVRLVSPMWSRYRELVTYNFCAVSCADDVESWALS
jgi:hypothetical protein